ncbi:MFS transporter [Acidaminobacter sp. JC074]|uniref:MFS transporter n=1 Tax=Acidaminobacter sp. JC074 TaxID=2530199 RepID=UPI001F10570B|nr:MFS transporter [Acidaminobacter sp. JC074]
MTVVSKQAPLKRSVLVGYGSAHFGYGFVTQMFASYFVFFATVILKMPGSIVGLVVSLSIVWDGISDPLMGYISDQTRSKLGKRHVYILIGVVLTSLINLFIWREYELSKSLLYLLIFTSVFLFKTSVTVFVTPYAALGAELSDDYDERNSIQGSKTVFFLLSLMIVTAVSMLVFFNSTPEYPLGQMNPKGYINMAYTASLVLIITGLWAYFSTQKYKLNTVTSSTGLKDFFLSISDSLKNTEFRSVFLGYLFTNIASAIISVVGLHTFTYTFEMNNIKISWVFGIQFTVCVLSQFIWLKVAKKIEKKQTVLIGLFISIIGCMLLFLFVVFRRFAILEYRVLFIYAVTIGFGTSGLFSIPLSMVVDTVDYQEMLTDSRREGVFFGLLNFGYKISQSIAILLLGFLLDIIKFDPLLTFQKSSTASQLGYVLSVGSLLSFILAFNSYRKYSLTRERVEEIQDTLKNTRHSLSSRK